MDAHHRRLLFKKWTRTLHIYISMLGLLTLIFFSATGIMLNHEEWFGFAAPRIVKKEGGGDRARTGQAGHCGEAPPRLWGDGRDGFL
ncbi:MAG: PepSY-associated TM helix domain-containing protein [Chthoniobacter sp.]|nr:PepSY-associated TM helix domain-containing protein [Chthoniobacter sp.]